MLGSFSGGEMDLKNNNNNSGSEPAIPSQPVPSSEVNLSLNQPLGVERPVAPEISKKFLYQQVTRALTGTQSLADHLLGQAEAADGDIKAVKAYSPMFAREFLMLAPQADRVIDRMCWGPYDVEGEVKMFLSMTRPMLFEFSKALIEEKRLTPEQMRDMRTRLNALGVGLSMMQIHM